MGLINASLTFVIGYFIIGFIKQYKKQIKDTNIPIISNLIDNTNKEVSSDAYLLLAGFVIKDLLI